MINTLLPLYSPAQKKSLVMSKQVLPKRGRRKERRGKKLNDDVYDDLKTVDTVCLSHTLADTHKQWKSLSTECKKWVQQLTPILSLYDYDFEDIVHLIHRCDVDGLKIQSEVDNICEERCGHEQNVWQVLSTRKEKKSVGTTKKSFIPKSQTIRKKPFLPVEKFNDSTTQNQTHTEPLKPSKNTNDLLFKTFIKKKEEEVVKDTVHNDIEEASKTDEQASKQKTSCFDEAYHPSQHYKKENHLESDFLKLKLGSKHDSEATVTETAASPLSSHEKMSSRQDDLVNKIAKEKAETQAISLEDNLTKQADSSIEDKNELSDSKKKIVYNKNTNLTVSKPVQSMCSQNRISRIVPNQPCYLNVDVVLPPSSLVTTSFDDVVLPYGALKDPMTNKVTFGDFSNEKSLSTRNVQFGKRNSEHHNTKETQVQLQQAQLSYKSLPTKELAAYFVHIPPSTSAPPPGLVVKNESYSRKNQKLEEVSTVSLFPAMTPQFDMTKKTDSLVAQTSLEKDSLHLTNKNDDDVLNDKESLTKKASLLQRDQNNVCHHQFSVSTLNTTSSIWGQTDKERRSVSANYSSQKKPPLLETEAVAAEAVDTTTTVASTLQQQYLNVEQEQQEHYRQSTPPFSQTKASFVLPFPAVASSSLPSESGAYHGESTDTSSRMTTAAAAIAPSSMSSLCYQEQPQLSQQQQQSFEHQKLLHYQHLLQHQQQLLQNQQQQYRRPSQSHQQQHFMSNKSNVVEQHVLGQHNTRPIQYESTSNSTTAGTNSLFDLNPSYNMHQNLGRFYSIEKAPMQQVNIESSLPREHTRFDYIQQQQQKQKQTASTQSAVPNSTFMTSYTDQSLPTVYSTNPTQRYLPPPPPPPPPPPAAAGGGQATVEVGHQQQQQPTTVVEVGRQQQQQPTTVEVGGASTGLGQGPIGRHYVSSTYHDIVCGNPIPADIAERKLSQKSLHHHQHHHLHSTTTSASYLSPTSSNSIELQFPYNTNLYYATKEQQQQHQQQQQQQHQQHQQQQHQQHQQQQHQQHQQQHQQHQQQHQQHQQPFYQQQQQHPSYAPRSNIIIDTLQNTAAAQPSPAQQQSLAMSQQGLRDSTTTAATASTSQVGSTYPSYNSVYINTLRDGLPLHLQRSKRTQNKPAPPPQQHPLPHHIPQHAGRNLIVFDQGHSTNPTSLQRSDYSSCMYNQQHQPEQQSNVFYENTPEYNMLLQQNGFRQITQPPSNTTVYSSTPHMYTNLYGSNSYTPGNTVSNTTGQHLF